MSFSDRAISYEEGKTSVPELLQLIEKVNMKSMDKKEIRCVPIVQYVTSFKLNLGDRPVILKKIKDKIVTFLYGKDRNTYNEGHDFGKRFLYTYKLD
jgi:hypothetical protein